MYPEILKTRKNDFLMLFCPVLICPVPKMVSGTYLRQDRFWGCLSCFLFKNFRDLLTAKKSVRQDLSCVRFWKFLMTFPPMVFNNVKTEDNEEETFDIMDEIRDNRHKYFRLNWVVFF